MNQTQIKYVRERANAIYNEKRKSIQNKYTVKALSTDQMVDAIQRGAFTIAPAKQGYSSAWFQRVIFTEQPIADTDKRDSELTALRVSYEKLLDNLILGDAQEALAMLKEFEAE